MSTMYEVDITPHRVVVLADGTEISLRIWTPRVPEGTRLPVVLESIPYRKDDLLLADDEGRHGLLASRGFVGIRMDLRGSGSSSGAIDDEVSAREADDTAQIVEWASSQPWSNGAIGLLGMSWGGMNALRVAGRGPRGLRAIAVAHATDDRYEDDVLYMGGALLGDAMLSWGAQVQHFAAYPPDPHIVGDRWRELWLERLGALPDPVVTWMSHQRRDAYWHPDGEIAVPVLTLGGWADPFRDTVLRLLDRLGPAAHGILGPWGHSQPYAPEPGPAIGWLQECVAWFDRHLRGGAGEPPPRLRYYVQDAIELSPSTGTRPGEWCEAEASDFGAVTTRWHLGADGALRSGALPAEEGILSHCSPLEAGAQAGEAMPGSGGFPAEQTDDDAVALAFTSAPLDAQLVVAGRAVVRLRLTADAPNVVVMARLVDVHPDGRSFHISYGALNAGHRERDDDVSPLEPGEWTDVSIPILGTATRIPAGHRLRVSISTQSWPLLWPLPTEATIGVDLARSWFELPVVDAPRRLRHPFAPPAAAPAPAIAHEQSPDGKTVDRYPHGLTVTTRSQHDRHMSPGDPLSAQSSAAHITRFERDGWSVEIESDARLTCTAEHFVVDAHVVAREGDAIVHEQRTRHEVRRDHT